MKRIMFTKHLEGKSVSDLVEILQSVGVEGADLCVRPGYPVAPDNVTEALPAAAREFAAAGLSIPLVTTPGEFLDPNDPESERVIAACGECGVEVVKLGYWRLTQPDQDYWQMVDECRRALEGFAALAAKHGTKVCVHNHSGSSMGLNSSAVMNLMRGFDPAHVGVFADTGHLALVGEPLPMAFNIVKDYLSAVAFKDTIREQYRVDGRRQWRIRVVPMGMGFVDWVTALKLLRERNFTGPVSFHSEYSELPVDSVIDQARMDVRYIDGLLAEME